MEPIDAARDPMPEPKEQPTKGLAHLKVTVQHVLNTWPAVLQRQLYLQAMNGSRALREALALTHAAHVHNALQAVLVVDLVREVGVLVLDTDSRTASVARAVMALRSESVLQELRAEYGTFTWRPGTSEAVQKSIHDVLLRQGLEELTSLPDYLKIIEDEVLSNELAKTMRTIRNKAVAHNDVAHDGNDWRMWRIEGVGLTYGQLDEFIDACTRAIDRLSRIVLRQAYAFGDLPGMSRQYADEYIEALVIGLNRQRGIREQRGADGRNGTGVDE